MKGTSIGIAILTALAVAGPSPSAKATTKKRTEAHRRQTPEELRAAFAAKVDEATKAGANAIRGKDDWLFFVPELRYLSAGKFWGPAATSVSKAPPTAADPLPAILDFKQQLESKGIDLLIVPVPAKAAIYPDKLVDGASLEVAARVDTAQAEFLKLLNSHNIKTIDLTATFLQYRRDHPGTPLYSKEDTHWSGAGINLAADAIAAIVKNEGWYGDAAKSKFVAKPTQVTVKGDLVDMLSDNKPGAETLNLTLVKTESGNAIASNRESPLVLLGDSHNLIYSIGDDMLATGSGLPENLSARLGFVPDVVGVRGSGATPSRVNLMRRGDNLAGKKMIVWVFTAREFTEGSGWKKVPVIKPPL